MIGKVLVNTMHNAFVYTVKSHREDHGALNQMSEKRRKEILAGAEAHHELELALHKAVAKYVTITNPLSHKRESGTFPSVVIHSDDRCGPDCPHCQEEKEQIRKCIVAIRRSDYAILALPSVCGGLLVENILTSCGNPKKPVPLLLLTTGPSSGPRRIDSMNFPCFNAGYTSLEDMEDIIHLMFSKSHLFGEIQPSLKIS